MVTLQSSDTTKMMTQVVRLVHLGLLEEVFATSGVVGPDGACESITSSQFEVVRYVDRHERPTIKEVALGLGMSSAAATKAVKGLSEERRVPLVRRARGSDRRTVRLTTTAAGHEIVRTVREAFTARLDDVFALMGDDEREALAQGLRGFLQAALTQPGECDAACLRCGIDHSDNCVVYLAEQRVCGEVVRERQC
jgi:DNA-binding MarR family transcriptional regulator